MGDAWKTVVKRTEAEATKTPVVSVERIENGKVTKSTYFFPRLREVTEKG